MLVEQLPECLSGRALWGEAVGSAERGLMPVRGCARRVVLLEILFQPFEFGAKPGARVRAAARLRRALYVERNKVPRTQIIGIPAICHSGLRLEMPRLSIRTRSGLGSGSSKARIVARRSQRWRARVGDRSRQGLALIRVIGRIDQEAVEVGKVAVAGNAGCAMLVIKLVVAGRRALEKFESAISQIERILKGM